MPGLASIVAAADAHHFSDDEILATADEFANAGNVKVSRLYQFSAVPAALVLIQFVSGVGADPTGNNFSLAIRCVAALQATGTTRPGSATDASLRSRGLAAMSARGDVHRAWVLGVALLS